MKESLGALAAGDGGGEEGDPLGRIMSGLVRVGE